MAQPTPQSGISEEKEMLRRSLQRSTAAAIVVLLVAVGLAVAAALSSAKSRRSQAEATESLWGALSAEAGGGDDASDYGSKQRTLDAIDAAVAIRPSPELRDRAIATLARTDLVPAYEVETPQRISSVRVEWTVIMPELDQAFDALADGSIVQRLIPSGEEIATFKQDPMPRYAGPIDFFWVSPDGRHLALRHDYGAVTVFNVATGEIAFATDESYPDRWIDTVVFHPAQPNLLCVSRNEEVRVFDLDTRKTVAKVGFETTPGGLAFDREGEQLAVQIGNSLAILNWATPEPEMLGKCDLPVSFAQFAWQPESDRITTAGSDGRVYLVDTASFEVARTFDGHGKFVHYLSYSPSGEFMESRAWDNEPRIWDSESGQPLMVTKGVDFSVFSEDGKQMAGKNSRKIFVHDIDSSSVYRPLASSSAKDSYKSVAFSPDGRLVAGGRDEIVIWESATGKVRSRRKGGGEWLGVAFTSDGHFLACPVRGDILKWDVGDFDGERDILSTETEILDDNAGFYGGGKVSSDRRWFSFLSSEGAKLIPISGRPHQVLTSSETQRTNTGNSAAVISPDEKFLACTDWHSDAISVHAFPSGARIARLESIYCGGAQFSPDSSELVTINKEEVTFWNTSDWSRGTTYLRPSEAASFCLGITWSGDGRLVAVGSESGKVQLLDGRDPDHPILATLKVPYSDRIYCLDFSSDGTKLVAGGTNGRCHLWDLAELERELDERGLHWEQAVSAEPEGVTAGVGGAIWLAGAGGIAAIIFGLFTVLYQRNLMRRFDATEAIAEQRAAELVEAEGRLAQSEKMQALGTLSAGVAHDFKNMLSVIRLSNDLIRRDADDRDDLLEEVEAIDHAVAQGDQVVKAMLGYSRHQTEDGAVNVPDVIEGTVSLLGQQFLSGVRLQLEVARDLPEVDIPQGALEQILLNLVVNASEAMAGKGQLSIRAAIAERTQGDPFVLEPRDAESYIRIEITDDGSGMDKDTVERIFEPFFTTKTVGADRGTGLGLATVYKIARDNRIGIGVESALGEGTGFSLLIPIL